MSLKKASLICVGFFMTLTGHTTTYTCTTVKKYNFEHVYSKAELQKWQFSTLLKWSDGSASISRCSYFSPGRNYYCDRYMVDKIVKDENIGLTKFYLFNSQYNFQLFSDLNALEDNGRGDISFQKCKIEK